MLNRIRILLFVLLLLTGCGSGSDSGKAFAPESGHPVGWTSPLSVGRESFHSFEVKRAISDIAGGVLFVRHCAPCHSDNAAGKIGPDIRNAATDIITGAIKVVPLMKGHSILSPEEIQAIAAYILLMKNGDSPVPIVINTSFCTECHGADVDGGIAKISCFSCHNGPAGGVGHASTWRAAKKDVVHFHGNYTPRFTDACKTCHGIDLKGGIGPACASCHDGTIAPVLNFLPQ